MDWISKSLKFDGLLIIDEPSIKNPIAKIGRKLIRDFHTLGEKPLNPIEVRQLALKYNLNLVYEKGLNFLTRPLQYLGGILKLPKPASVCAYHFARFVDYFVNSPLSIICLFKYIKSNEQKLESSVFLFYVLLS